MRPAQILRSGGGGPVGKYGHYLGGWGNFGGQKQKGIISYGLAANRQNPFAGALNDAVFNTWRRSSAQVLYWLPPMLMAYYALDYATKRNHYLYSKAGKAELGDDLE